MGCGPGKVKEQLLGTHAGDFVIAWHWRTSTNQVLTFVSTMLIDQVNN
jgi:hypothetical protein